MALVNVESWEEEWRTNTVRRQTPMGGRARWSFGRACLWIRLVCGHHVQRMVSLNKDGSHRAPVRVRCSECA